MRFPVVLFALALLAGCVDQAPPDAPSGPEGDATPASFAWNERADAPVILAETAVATDGARIFVVGGWTQAGGGSPLALAYDAQNDSWATLPPYPLAVHHAQAAAIDGTLYVFGGALTGAVMPGSLVGVGPAGWPRTPLAFKLEPGAASWTPIASMPEARGLGAAVAVDGKAYLVGGIGLEGYLAAVHVYDPATDAYAEAPPLPTPRDHLNLVLLEGRLHAIAGRSNAGGAWDDLATHEALDLASGTWTARADAPVPGGGQGAGVLAGGLIAVVGGEAIEGDFAVHDAAHAYDPSMDAWTLLPPMPEARHGMASAAWNGTLFAMGGGTLEGAIRSGTLALEPASG